jgi:hypothetical protein
MCKGRIDDQQAFAITIAAFTAGALVFNLDTLSNE